MTKFEEQFPSLIKKNRDKNCDDEWMDWFYESLLYEGGMDDSCGHANTIEEASYVDIDHVKEYCIDKQRVKEALIRLKARNTPNKQHELYSFDCNIKILEKELGLDN